MGSKRNAGALLLCRHHVNWISKHSINTTFMFVLIRIYEESKILEAFSDLPCLTNDSNVGSYSRLKFIILAR